MIITSPANLKRIIYEDQHIVVIYKPGNSEFILCTFGDLYSLASGDKMYAELAISKLGYAAISFMAKSQNWFPQVSVIKAIEKIASIIRNYSSVVSYGGSMGGYAAIKYSKLLGASHTIACCPQWTIDPGQCNGRKNGYEKYFNPEMKGMGITGDDVFGSIFVLYDPYHEVDSFHFNNIRSQSESITGVHVPFVGHDVTAVMAGTENLRRIIDAVRILDSNSLGIVINGARRKSPKRHEYILNRSVSQHPFITAKLILLGSIKTPAILNILNKAISIFVKNSEYQKILDLAFLSGKNSDSHQYDLVQKVINSIEELKKRNVKKITTSHNTTLFYNVFTSSLCHDVDNSPMFFMSILKEVYSISIDSDEYLAVSNEGLYYFVEHSQGRIYLSDKVSINSIKKKTLANGKCCFVNDSKYMCAEKGGLVCINRTEAKAWEFFVN